MDDFPVQPVETPRGRFACRVTGSGPPLVMLHGWPESSRCWWPVASRLAGRYRVIAPDLRGLGDAERSMDLEAYTKQALGADLLALLDVLEVPQATLIGHDWGGAIAQEAALAEPGRFDGLVLLNIHVLSNARGNASAQAALRNNPAALWYQFFQNARDDRGQGLAEAMIPGNERAWLGHFLRTWSRRDFPADALDEYVRCYRQPHTATTGANYYRTYKTDRARWAELAGRRFAMPGLYIHGRHDPVIVPEFTQHLDDAFDDIRLESLDAAHFVQEECPDQVAELIGTFAGLVNGP
ncbi:alpha/beta hydrolase [Spectribacter hydrogenoxidans]|uniref:Alpha/beta hydrolase n=1 Tax=Spectribacter hydrogenoxidans TaxID=3075608 RepID=A0ABU3BZG4_9GAMM|nr:alpha/beta hydrolase [Salinisphaera sp. W335]MDT0634702.1 alpha/beta hydrolase [Salinisphaera sp. W335]